MSKNKLTCLATIIALSGCNSNQEGSNSATSGTSTSDTAVTYQTQFKIVTANMWNSLSRNFDSANTTSFDVAMAELKHADPDVILFTEASGVTLRMAAELNMHVWQGPHSQVTTGIASKYPIISVLNSSGENSANGSNIGAVLNVNGREVVVWSNHLDYTNYITYDIRGGNGISWEARKNCEPIVDQEELDKMNARSSRPKHVQHMINETQPYLNKNRAIFFGGDFNEASGLDWNDDTANKFDHRGAVHDFLSHRLLRNAGYTDSYRELYPNPVTHPGITWPFHAADSWTKGPTYQTECKRSLDDRDRIDFIYYNSKAEGINLIDASIIGPRANTYFKGPHGDDDNYVWDDRHTGMHVDKNGEPQYGERDFVSDHLWYSSTYTLTTPNNKTTAKSNVREPQFENVKLNVENNQLIISFELNNLVLWQDNWNYLIDITGDRTIAETKGWQSIKLKNKPKDTIKITLDESVLKKLVNTKHNRGIQLRLRKDSKINGWTKHYAIKTITTNEIKKHINLPKNES